MRPMRPLGPCDEHSSNDISRRLHITACTLTDITGRCETVVLAGGVNETRVDRQGPSNGKSGIRGGYRDTLYGQRQNYDGMVQTVESMVCEGAKINALVVRSDDLLGALESWTPKQYIAIAKSLGDKTVLDLEKRDMAPESNTTRLQIAIAEIPDNATHYCAVSDCKLAVFNGVFIPFIYKHSTNISNLFLTNGDMKSILDSIESQGYNVDVKYGSTKSREHATGAPESGTMSTTKSIATFFAALDKEGKAAITVRYTANPNIPGKHGARTELRGTITRECRFSASGNADVLFKTIIPKALILPRERNRCIEESAKSAGSDAVEPAVIVFDKKIFKDKSRNRRYVDMIAKMADSSISEYHVNPHIHLSLVDYTDGSSYDIWVVTSDKLVIIPQIRASGASLKRLINHIFKHMGEGNVKKYEH